MKNKDFIRIFIASLAMCFLFGYMVESGLTEYGRENMKNLPMTLGLLSYAISFTVLSAMKVE